jgi:anti-sigma factor RsiW
MQGNTQNIGEHVGELLSGFIDGELTQQERQRVELHCDACRDCTEELEAVRDMRVRVGSASLGEYGEDKWREMMDDTTVRVSRGIGWLLLIGAALAVGGIAVFTVITDPTIGFYEKLLIGAVYGGAAALFVSVLRQRLIERKTDKYKDVEI